MACPMPIVTASPPVHAADGGIARVKAFGTVAPDMSSLLAATRPIDLISVENGGAAVGWSDRHYGWLNALVPTDFVGFYLVYNPSPSLYILIFHPTVGCPSLMATLVCLRCSDVAVICNHCRWQVTPPTSSAPDAA